MIGEEGPSLAGTLKQAYERVSELGMRRGLWVEIEGVGASSRLLKEHPQWLMQSRGEVIPRLDLTHPQVESFVEDTMVGLIETYGLDCLRLDYNFCVGEGGDRVVDGYCVSDMWSYYDVLYGLFDRVQAAFPDLILENCASGGGTQ